MPLKPNYKKYAAQYPEGGEELLHVLGQCEAIVAHDSPYRASAKIFERAYKVKGISAKWKMPEGYNEETLQNELVEKLKFISALEFQLKYQKDYISPNRVILDDLSKRVQDNIRRFAPKLHPILDDLIIKAKADFHQFATQKLVEMKQLNPGLADISINPDNEAMDAFHVLAGCASQFNKADIAFYLEDLHADDALRNAESYKELKNKTAALGIWGWIPSPETIQKVLGQLQQQRGKGF